jgi:capsid protein
VSWFGRLISSVGLRLPRASGRIVARHEAAISTTSSDNHFAYSDAMDARASLSPEVRRKLRMRMRYEAENCAWLAGMLATAANHIVGNGPKLQVLIDDRAAADRFESAWAEYSEAIQFASLLRTLVRTDWCDGEAVGLRVRADLHPEFRVMPRLYEADQLADPFQKIGDPYIEDGVRIDPESGLPVEYHILDAHPGSNVYLSTLSGRWHKAEDVIHTFRADRPGQLRGVSRGAAGLIDLATLRRFERATVRAAENAARNAETIESAAGAGAAASDQAAFAQIDLPDSGAMFLPQGWSRSAFKPEHPATTFEMFVRANLTKFARCYGMPYHIALGSSRESNYSSAILDQTIAWVAEVQAEQKRIERQAVEKAYRWFLDEAMFASGKYRGLLDGLPAISEIPHAWQWDPPPTGDEQDRVEAANARVAAGFSAPSTECALLGRDFAAEERRAAQDLGITVDELRQLRKIKLFGLDPAQPFASAPAAAAPAPGGEFGGLGRRQFTNNVKAVRDVLDGLIAGTNTPTMALTLLQSLGLSPDRAAALIQDAQDGRIDAPELSSVEAAASVSTMSGPAVVSLSAAVAGKPRRFDILAYTGGKLSVSGAPLPVVVDLSALAIAQHVPILIDHTKAVDATLGQVEAVINDGLTLRLQGVVTGASPKCLQVLAQADKGHKWQASIGCNYEGVEVPEGQSVVVNGQQIEGPFILARSAELRETSVLPMGADSRTTVNLAAAAALSGKAQTMPTFEDWVKSLGMDPASLTPEVATALQTAYAAQQSGEAEAKAAPAAAPVAPAVAATPTPSPAVAAHANLDLTAASVTMLGLMRKQAAEEAARIGAIREIVAEIPDAKVRGRIEAAAIQDNWSREKTELAVLKETRPKAPNGIVHNNDASPQVLEAALAMSAGLPSLEKHYKEETLDKAARQYRGIGLQRLLLIEACARGFVAGPGERIHTGNIRSVLQAAFGSLSAAAPTTLSLPGILSNVANKEILQGYMEEDQTWQEVSAVKSVSDFKTVTSYRMLDNMEYEELPAGGTIKHGKVGEESYTRQAKTYAKMMQFDRVDIINDDLSVFDDIRRRLGAGAAKKLNNVFWLKFLDNSSFFTSGRGNYISGATTNLGTDGVGLGLALKAFRTMKAPKVTSSDAASKQYRIGGNPEILVVPPELEEIANRLFITDPAASTAASGTNVYFKKYRPVVVPWLSDTDFTGYSTTAWYLFRATNVMAPMVVSFLNGQRTPTVESTDANFDTLGVVFRGYHDFGVDQAEYLAGVKSKGAA